jgi:hypothetical protein
MEVVNKDTGDKFIVNNIELELKLNLSPYSKKWSFIGDHIYNYFIKNYKEILYVTSEQWYCLKELNDKSY